MKTPSFRHMGGKARLRNWLIEQFPRAGRTYWEPFCGKGNVFWKARTELEFEGWVLADLDNSFLLALQDADLEDLPETVTKETFREWKTREDAIAKVIEPRVTFAGKGYPAGFSGTSGTHVGYSRKSYLPMCEKAKELLTGVALLECDWRVPIENAEEGDFIYCDPPYLGTEACYGNIDHAELIKVLNASPAKWAISGYPSQLYDEGLDFKVKTAKIRNSEIMSSNAREWSGVMEVLWRNYV